MPPERTSSLELTGLEEAFDWLKARKNVLLGTLVVVALVLAVTTFVRRQLRESAVDPWRPVFSAEVAPWNARSTDLAAIAAVVPRGSGAEAYALYWQALQRFDEGNGAEALTLLESFRSRFPDHPLVKAGLLPADDALTRESPIARTRSAIQRFQHWESAHPHPASNPDSSTLRRVTLTTERGSIVLALYGEHAPKSCEAFLRVASALKDHFLARALPDRWVELGHDEAGSPVETGEFTEGFPPFEFNQLVHVAGAVSFRQLPFQKAPYHVDLRILLTSDFNEDERTTVFAQVIEGLDLLRSISKEERKSDSPQVLARPLKLEDVKMD
jgi:cyclophilin family peptidyl-prolyl cis-trans isomerase